MSASFEGSERPPASGQSHFSPEWWTSLRDQALTPQNVSEFSTDDAAREEFIRGAELLQLHGERAHRNRTLFPQQLLLADVVNGGGAHIAVLEPRRASKTSSLLALAMGRVASRDHYRVCYVMATTGMKARERFLQDIVGPLDRLYPDRKTRPFKINLSRGGERVEWSNGSLFAVEPPKGDSLRGDSWDLIIIDEAGSASPDATMDLLAGAVSTQDTIPDAQLIVAGTATDMREGSLLFDCLALGRAGDWGILEYAAPDTTTVHDIAVWDDAAELVLTCHPGIGNLTTLEKVHDSYKLLGPELFLMEYLGVFAKAGSVTLFNPDSWAKLQLDGSPLPPAHFRLAMAVTPNMNASIVAAWRVDGVAHVATLWQGSGTDAIYAETLRLSRKYKLPVIYDGRPSGNAVIAEKLGRARPKPRLEPQVWGQVSTAAALMKAEIDAGTIRHWEDPPLAQAISCATRRGSRDSERWAFGRASDADDITALEAASLALRAYDEAKAPAPRLGIVTAS